MMVPCDNEEYWNIALLTCRGVRKTDFTGITGKY